MKYYHYAFGLEEEPRVQTLFRRMSFEGIGIFDMVVRRVRLGRGLYALDSLLSMANTEARRRKVQRVLTEFDLFVVENGMVSLREGLSASSFNKGESMKDKVKKVDEIRKRTYTDTFFPEELQAMDEKAADTFNDEIRKKVMRAVEI